MSESESDKHSIQLELDNNKETSNKPQEENEESNGQSKRKQSHSHKKLDVSNFIMKTFRILDEKRNANVIEWTDEGNCFIVKSKELLEKEVLPKYFKHSKFSSFVRQLNMYDFHKIRKEKEIPIFKHKFFKMGCEDLLHKIKRKSGGERGAIDEENEPHVEPSERPHTSECTINQSLTLKHRNMRNVASEMDLMVLENHQLKSQINQLNRDLAQGQLSRERMKDKLVKMISTVMFFSLDIKDNMQEECNLRDLQNHFINEEDPMSFSDYTKTLSSIFSQLKKSVIA